MRRPGVAFALVLGSAAAFASPEPPPSNQTLVFYNARVSLRENRPTDVLKLWLLRNSLVHRGEPGAQDDDFRSVVWAATGRLGLCQDGLRKDDRGAGLWPLALHNWVLHALSKGEPPPVPAPWNAFNVARQQRFVSLHDVLSAEELRSVEFFRTDCLMHVTSALERGSSPTLDVTDRIRAGFLLRELLELSRTTLVRDKVQSTAVIDARIFDLDLALAELQARQARREGRDQAQRARSAGVSKSAAEELRERISRFPETSPQVALLRRSLGWTADEWLSLSRQRRLFLFAQAKPLSKDPEALQRQILSVADALIARREGRELEIWIGHLGAAGSARLRQEVTAGDRGARLLELEPATGFRERSAIALHRGVAFLEEGKLQDALRSFAYAMRYAEESRESAATAALARRWLSYALSRFETTGEVIATVRSLVPRQEYNAVVEDLLWRAALSADAPSFERLSATVRPGTALDARMERLRPLAQGNPGALATRLRKEAKDEPYSVLRFARVLVERVEAEDANVRSANVPTLKLLRGVLIAIAEGAGNRRNAHARAADELLDRAQAILDGLLHLDDSEPGRARALSPRSETFAGSIRLAPADALPWPFDVPEAEPVSAFAQLELTPVEWRDGEAARVFGWRISE